MNKEENLKTAKKIDLATGSIPKLLIRLALPAVVAQIINMLYNLIDRIYVGRIEQIGTYALAGLGVCFPIILIVTAFSALIGMGGAPLAAIRLGEKKREDAEKILNNGFVLLFAIGIALTVVLLIFSRQLLILFGAPDQSLIYADRYLKIYAAGTIFVMLSMGLNTFISAQGFALTSMITVAIGAALNIALDPLFIFVFGMGVQGAALATIISQAVSCAWIIVFFLSKRTGIRLNLKHFRLRAYIILPMLALGVSPFIMQATESAVQIVFNIQLKAYTGGADSYTAALTIMMSVMQLISLPLNGLGTGAQPLISYNYGAGNSHRVKQTVKYLFFTALIICFIVWLSCLTIPSIYAAIFSANAEVTEIIKKYMPIFMMGSIMFCAQFALQNAFIALSQAKISMILALLRKVILLIPLTFILPLFLGTQGIFLAEGVADLTAGTITALTFIFTFNGILRKREAFLITERETAADKKYAEPYLKPEEDQSA
jgi:MATE efflux family protein